MCSLQLPGSSAFLFCGDAVKPLECVFFMRDVRSPQYFEQMKGRGARTIPSADFRAVTPDATEKTRFVIVDAVGVTEHDFVEPPLNREKGVSLKKLLERTASLQLTEDDAATLASRLSVLELQLDGRERAELDEVAGRPLREIVRGIVDAVDADTQAKAIAASPDEAPAAVIDRLIEAAITPLASNPDLRNRILELRQAHDRVIDEVSIDELLDAHGVVDPDRARSLVADWSAYLREHRSEITAIQLLSEAKEARVSFSAIQELADRISRPPHSWTPDLLWSAYAQVETSRVKPHTAKSTLTDLVSLLRFTLGEDPDLVPYADRVGERYVGWLQQQQQAGTTYTLVQRWWLDRMADVIASSAGLSADDLDDAPFAEHGGVDGALRDLGSGAGALLEALNQELTA